MKTAIPFESIDRIGFDESDQNLFQVDEPRLRAEAIQYSILPRLRRILDEGSSLIRDIYGIETFDDSIVSYSPHFRKKRKNELALLYPAAHTCFGGKRTSHKWFGMERKDKKPIHIVPFTYGFMLSEKGLAILLQNHWLTGLCAKSYKKIFHFHLRYEHLVHTMSYRANMKPQLIYGDERGFISTFQEHYRFMLQIGRYDNCYNSVPEKFPITPTTLRSILQCFAVFYPVYDSYLQIAMGKPVRLYSLIAKLNEYAIENFDKEETKATDPKAKDIIADTIKQAARKAAESKIRVMPAIRWQVFQRDQWKCVSCGRTALDGIILHVDHIVPRSKNGTENLHNLQTLCHLCNIGKSNKDKTNLRNRQLSTQPTTDTSRAAHLFPQVAR